MEKLKFEELLCRCSSTQGAQLCVQLCPTQGVSVRVSHCSLSLCWQNAAGWRPQHHHQICPILTRIFSSSGEEWQHLMERAEWGKSPAHCNKIKLFYYGTYVASRCSIKCCPPPLSFQRQLSQDRWVRGLVRPQCLPGQETVWALMNSLVVIKSLIRLILTNKHLCCVRQKSASPRATRGSWRCRRSYNGWLWNNSLSGEGFFLICWLWEDLQ